MEPFRLDAAARSTRPLDCRSSLWSSSPTSSRKACPTAAMKNVCAMNRLIHAGTLIHPNGRSAICSHSEGRNMYSATVHQIEITPEYQTSEQSWQWNPSLKHAHAPPRLSPRNVTLRRRPSKSVLVTTMCAICPAMIPNMISGTINCHMFIFITFCGASDFGAPQSLLPLRMRLKRKCGARSSECGVAGGKFKVQASKFKVAAAGCLNFEP
jgi:hypothetical protein